jgi:serine/threonine-protein kinase
MVSKLRNAAHQAELFGQYRLRRKLGSGGMGDVYLADHRLLKRPSAIKLIRPGYDTNVAALARFELEVQATAQLSHWNTVEIFDYGTTEDGTFYYVMEYLPGMSLHEIARQHGPLPAPRVVHFLRQICGALREAHRLGLVHRDIKPANIYAAFRGGLHDVAKLLDFGLVELMVGSSPPEGGRASPQKFVAGSPYFMAPEQASAGAPPDPRSDIFSLGATAYFLLTGAPPFAGTSPRQLLRAWADGHVRPPTEWRADVPLDLEQVILRCLAIEPEHRYQDIDQLDQALAACGCAIEWNESRAAAWWQQHGLPDEFAADETTPSGVLTPTESNVEQPSVWQPHGESSAN